ncbi:LuxR C-terminal-related transcriptional regulator [Enterobacter adelaidei]
MTTIAIIDSHPLFAQGVGHIASEAGYHVTDVFTDARTGFASLLSLQPDIVILGLHVDENDDGEIINMLNTLKLPTKIIVMTRGDDEAKIVQLAEQGVSGCVITSRPPSELLQALNLVSAGGVYYPGFKDSERASQTTRATQPTHLVKKLGRRETSVLTLLADGKRNKEIAEALGLSPKTISTYKVRICQKLGARNLITAIDTARVRKIIG